MYELELYTHPWCSDCQASKRYLKKAQVPFAEHDLSLYPEKEEELRKHTGSRIVPGFVFRKKSLFSKFQKPTTFTGFEINKAKVVPLVQKMRKDLTHHRQKRKDV